MYSTNLNIYDYDNFRNFLKDSVEQVRNLIGPEFSYRKFSAVAGFSSPNFLILLIKGERNLSAESATKIATAFGLAQPEKNFFVSLVQYNQAKDSKERYNWAFELVKLKAKTKLTFISEKQFEYYSHWSNVAIRELLQFQPYLTIQQIAQRLSPVQKTEAVEASLLLMQQIGMIEATENQWKVRDSSISTGDNFISSSVIEFHKQVIELAKQSLDRHSKNDRDITASTVSLSKETLEKIRQKVKELRIEILALSDADTNKQEVYQINFQIFPLSKEVAP